MTEWVSLEQLKKERNEALLSLDEQKIRAYARHWGVVLPPSEDPEMFWIAVHKARVHLKALPKAERDKSAQWLHERGYSTGILGAKP